MQNVYLDGEEFEELGEVHAFLAEEMSFPKYYGRNLAALYDVLTEVCAETQIVVANAGALNGLERMVEVMQDAAESNGRLTVVIK